MKSRTVLISRWQDEFSDEYIDIDWPKIQRHIGVDQVKWLLEQPSSKLQLVVEKTEDDFKLIAEFYDDQLLTFYHLMWAK